MNTTFYAQWLGSCRQAGIPAISSKTCAKILAIVYVYAGSMELIFNTKMKTEIEYAKRRANLSDGEMPNGLIKQDLTIPQIAEKLPKYTYEQIYDTILCDLEFNTLYRKHGQLKIKKKK